MTVLPDGCTALCLNLGENFRSLNFGTQVKNEGIYLIGTAQRIDEQVLQSEDNLDYWYIEWLRDFFYECFGE